MARIDGESLLAPNGPIQTVLFPNVPGNVLETMLDAFVSRAYLDARVLALTAEMQDEGARALALHFAFMDVWTRMNAEPLNATLTDKGSSGYSVAQIANIKLLADQYLAELTDLEPASTAAVDIGTAGVPTTFVW